MPQKKKPASEMTDEEILKRVFPKRVVEELKKQVSDSNHDDQEQDSKE